MTIFGSLELGRKALMAQYKGVEVSGQNIANANTPGYTRQRVDMESIVPSVVPGNKMVPGHGVKVSDVVRINSDFYHTQIVNNGSYKAKWDTLLEAYKGVEVIFMEPAEEGLNKYLEDFFDTWHDLAAAPENIAIRMSLLETSYNFTTMIQDNYQRLSDLRGDFSKELELTVQDVNRLLDEIAEINDKLMFVDAYQTKSNELMDHMDLTLEELGKLMDVRVYQKSNGTVDIFVEGRLLVHEKYANHIELKINNDELAYDLYPTYEVINHQGVTLNFQHGRLTGLLETVNTVIPSVQSEMNELVSTLVHEVNEIHNQSYNLEFDPAGNFFEEIDHASDIPPILQFFMREDILGDPNMIGAASAVAQPGNGESALEMAQLRKVKVMANGTATIPDYYRGLITAIAVKGQESEQLAKIYETTEAKLREQHKSIAGVSIDEEMLNLIQFQTAWQAAAKFINYIDEMLGVLLQLGHR